MVFSGKTGAGIGALIGGLLGGPFGAVLGGAAGAAASQVHKGLGRYPNAKVLDFKSDDVWANTI